MGFQGQVYQQYGPALPRARTLSLQEPHSTLGLSWASFALRVEAQLELPGEGQQVPWVPLAGSSSPSVPGPYSPVLCLGLLWSLFLVPTSP